MRDMQRTIIDTLGVRPEIDPAAEIERRVQFLVDYLRSSGAAGYVLGLSGGVDSTLAGRLAQLAVERVRGGNSADRDAIFVGMRLPYRVQHDEADAVAAVEFVAADETLTVDIAPGVDGLNKRQARALLRHLGAPRRLWEKVPTADLLDENVGRTDEDELGLGYHHIDDYLEGREVPDAAAERIEAAWRRGRHKRTTPVGVTDTWWRPGPRTALVVIDMQNSYFEFPALAEVRDELVSRVNELIAAAHGAGRPVVLVRTEHARDRSTWTLNMCDDDEGFAFPGTEQARFLDGLDVGGHVEVVKTRDSAFFGTSLADELDRRGVDHLLLCGVSTHSCVAQTAIDGFAENLHVAVAHDAIASDDAALSAALLEFLSDQMRQPIIDQSAALELLRAGGWPDRPAQA